jgi:hypothetical protein
MVNICIPQCLTRGGTSAHFFPRESHSFSINEVFVDIVCARRAATESSLRKFTDILYPSEVACLCDNMLNTVGHWAESLNFYVPVELQNVQWSNHTTVLIAHRQNKSICLVCAWLFAYLHLRLINIYDLLINKQHHGDLSNELLELCFLPLCSRQWLPH